MKPQVSEGQAVRTLREIKRPTFTIPKGAVGVVIKLTQFPNGWHPLIKFPARKQPVSVHEKLVVSVAF